MVTFVLHCELGLLFSHPAPAWFLTFFNGLAALSLSRRSDPVLMEFLLKLKQDRPALFGGAVEEVIDSNYIFFKNASPDLLDRLRPEVDNWMRVRLRCAAANATRGNGRQLCVMCFGITSFRAFAVAPLQSLCLILVNLFTHSPLLVLAPIMFSQSTCFEEEGGDDDLI